MAETKVSAGLRREIKWAGDLVRIGQDPVGEAVAIGEDETGDRVVRVLDTPLGVIIRTTLKRRRLFLPAGARRGAASQIGTVP
ncbi:MAG TPA: hypothetical protein VMP03_08000 [Methylomirabilota bacterium]|nr:hypothetical protein [Methylomirabilota bacterium]